MNFSSPSPLDTVLSSHPSYSYEEGGDFLMQQPTAAIDTKLDETNVSTLKDTFNTSPSPSQYESKPMSKKKTSRRRSQVKNACVNCQKACKKCDEGRPCQRCIKLGITDTCINSPRKERKKGFKRGPYRKKLSAGPQRIVSKKDLVMPVVSQSVLNIEETPTTSYLPTYISSTEQWSQSPPSLMENAQFYDDSVQYNMKPPADNIAEQQFYSFYSNRNNNQSINHSSFDNVCQPKITTTTNNRVNDINNSTVIDTVPEINDFEQYNLLMVQRQSFSSDEYDIYPETKPTQDYLSPINYDYNAMPVNFDYANRFDMTYHVPQYVQTLVPKLQATNSVMPPIYDAMADMNNTFPPQSLEYKSQYAQNQQYNVEKSIAFPNSNQWLGRPDINSQHYYYNNQQY